MTSAPACTPPFLQEILPEQKGPDDVPELSDPLPLMNKITPEARLIQANQCCLYLPPQARQLVRDFAPCLRDDLLARRIAGIVAFPGNLTSEGYIHTFLLKGSKTVFRWSITNVKYGPVDSDDFYDLADSD